MVKTEVNQSELIDKYFWGSADKSSDFTVTFLDEDNLQQLVELNSHVIVNLQNPLIYHPPYDVELLKFCLSEGLAIGVFSENRLVAYQLTYYPDLRADNLGRDIGFPTNELKNIAQFHGIAVHLEYRTRRFGFSLTKYALHIVRELGFTHVTATCHPENLHSLQILFKSGFNIIKLKDKYEGKLRYILHKAFNITDLKITSERVIECNDITTQKRMLDEGYLDFKLKASDKGYEIIFVR